MTMCLPIYNSSNYKLAFSPAIQETLQAHQQDFMQEDARAGMIYAFLEDYTGNRVCSKQLYTADGRGAISISKTMQRANKDALEKLDPNQVYHTFPDRRAGSKSSLILKKPKTKKSNRILYMTKPLKAELLAWLEKLKQDEQNAPGKYSNCGQLFRLSDGLPIAPELLTKWYRLWRAEHPEFEQIVFHGLRHSSATYQLMISGGNVKAVQGTTGHATADMLVNTYAHIQQSSRVELGRKFEEGFYAKQESPSPQAVPAAGEPTISMTALLELLKNADPEVKAQLRLALLT